MLCCRFRGHLAALRNRKLMYDGFLDVQIYFDDIPSFSYLVSTTTFTLLLPLLPVMIYNEMIQVQVFCLSMNPLINMSRTHYITQPWVTKQG